MCAKFMVDIDLEKISSTLRTALIAPPDVRWEKKILPSVFAPIVTSDHGILRLSTCRFGLIPAWSKEPKVKFATHNARLDTVLEKPTWREPFRSRHCLVPLTRFFEAVRSGPHAGNWIGFHSVEMPLLFAAGIWDSWGSGTASFQSFSILTDNPHPFVEENGHDRTPVFLLPNAGKEWLGLKLDDPRRGVDFLRANATIPDWSVERDAALKS